MLTIRGIIENLIYLATLQSCGEKLTEKEFALLRRCRDDYVNYYQAELGE